MGRQIRTQQVTRGLHVLLTALLAAGGRAHGQPREPSPEPPEKKLVLALGSENWEERESAQLRLLEKGPSVAPLLEQASRSQNLELAYRARYLLARIDPRITAFQVVRIATGREVRVLDAAAGAGAEGEELSARPVTGESEAGGYTLQFHADGSGAGGDSDDSGPGTGPGGRLEIWISRARQGMASLETRCEIVPPASAALVHRGEECLYRRMGLEVTRERRPYITIVRMKTGRRSLLDTEPFSSNRETILEEVLRDVEAQARAPHPEGRSAAIEMLGELGRYRGPLDEHLANPATRDAASYASGRQDLLEDLIRRAFEGEDAPAESSAAAIRAAAKLAEGGHSGAAETLIEKLLDPEPPHPHLILACLADAVRDGKLPRETRAHIQRKALGEEALTRVPWDDVESEHFFTAMIAALDPEDAEERELAREFLSSLERLARGELGPVAVRLRAVIELWRRAARKAPGAGALESRMLLGILPHLNGAASFSEAAVMLEDVLLRGTTRGESQADLVPGLLEILEANIAAGDPGLVNVSFQSLLRLSKALPAEPGQLGLLAGALVRACEAAARDPGVSARGTQRSPVSPAAHLLRQAEEILAGWTGIAAPPAAAGTRKPDTAAWRSWLEDAARVEARETEILAARSAGSESEESRFVYYEFDLATGDPKKNWPRAQVLDARRLELRISRPVLYRDRWGNEAQIRIDPEPRGGKDATRFRVNSRPMLFAGLPALQPIQGRDLSASWHDSSDLTTSSTPIVGADAPAFRSLVLLLPAAEDLDPPPPGSPEDLWAWFLERRLLALPPEASPQRVQAVLGVVRVLEPRQAAPLVRSLFDKQPSLELAKLLHELGDAAGVPFLRAEFAKGADARVRAAMALLELGIPEGFRGLQGPDIQRPILRRMHFQVVNAIEAYLKHPRATPEGREQALGFFFEWLDDAAYQPRAFAIIQREIGLDFGYGTARGMDDQERRAAALETCVRAARSWWQARSGAK